MASLNIPSSWTGLAGLATNKPLSDPTLPNAPQTLALPAQNQTVSLPNGLGSINVTADENCSFAVVNSPKDNNVDGYFLFPSAGPAPSGPAGQVPPLEAPVTFDSTLAYVVLTGLSANGKVAGQVSLGSDAALSLNGSAAVDVSSCTAFPGATPVWDALTSAALKFKTLFSAGELRDLAAGETVSYGFQGSLKLGLALNAASLAPLAAAALEEVFNQVGPFQFTAGPSATLALSLGVTDGYRVFAQRAGGGTTFSVTKQGSTSLGLDGGLGLTIGLTDSAVTDWVNGFIAEAGGVAEDALADVLGANPSQLTAGQLSTLGTLAGKLGLGNVPAAAASRLQTLAGNAQTAAAKKLKLTVSAQFTYSWCRLTSNSLAVRFTVPDAALDSALPEIIGMDLTGIMSADPATGIVVDRWLGQETVSQDLGYGFSFGIAGYAFLKSQDALQDRFVTLNAQTGGGQVLRQFAFLGKRSYASSWCGSSQTNYAELDASMLKYLPNPTADDFQVGLSIGFTWGDKLGSILTTVADHGVALGAFATDDVPTARKSLLDQGVDGEADGTAVVSIAVPDAALELILPKLTSDEFLQFASNALARSLPCTDSNQQFAQRAQAGVRTQAYAQMFCDFLTSDTPDDSTVPLRCGQDLPGTGCPNPLTVVEQDPGLTTPWTAGSIVQMAGPADLQDDVMNGAARAFKLLQQRPGDFHPLFSGVVDAFSGLAAQNFGCRTLAGLLYLAATEVSGALGLIDRTVTLTWKDAAGKSHTVVSKGN